MCWPAADVSSGESWLASSPPFSAEGGSGAFKQACGIVSGGGEGLERGQLQRGEDVVCVCVYLCVCVYEKTYLNKVLAFRLCHQRLKLGSGKGVYETRFGDDEEQDLGTGQDGKLISLRFGEGGGPPKMSALEERKKCNAM